MDNKYIGILTSGGDASGMNAAIKGGETMRVKVRSV